MTTHRFDPTPGEPYGTCRDCDQVLADQDAAAAHIQETMAGNRASHQIQVTNGTRAQRVNWHVDNEVTQAVDKVLDDLAALVTQGVLTQDEVEAALGDHLDFADAWANNVDELLED